VRLCHPQIGAGFDTSVHVTQEQAAAMKAAGYTFRVGYVRRDRKVNDEPDDQWPISLSHREVREHIAVGLDVGFYQFPRMHGKNWLGNDDYCREVGYNAARNAADLAGIDGATVYHDCEWTDEPDAELVLRGLGHWIAGCVEGKGRPGGYIGFEGLTGEQWYSLPHMRTYMRSAMLMRTYQRAAASSYAERLALITEPLPRGWSMLQGWQHSDRPKDVRAGRPAVCGIAAIDPCWATYDNIGDRPYFVTA